VTSAALLLAVLGAVLDSAYRDASVFGIWPPLLVVSWGLPALALLASRTRAGRWVALGAAVVTGLVALPLVPYGYGLYQLPTVVLLAVAAGRDR
jgi:hypothetical protein